MSTSLVLYRPAYPADATPGPWEAHELHPGGFIKKQGWEIATPGFDVACWRENGAPFRREADAILAAAAPTLAAGLFQAVQYFELSIVPDAITLETLKNALRQAGIDLDAEPLETSPVDPEYIPTVDDEWYLLDTIDVSDISATDIATDSEVKRLIHDSKENTNA